MAVNTNIWGQPETWKNFTTQKPVAKTSQNHAFYYVENNVWNRNELIDNSPCFCGVVDNDSAKWYLYNSLVFFQGGDDNPTELPLFKSGEQLHNWFVVNNSDYEGYGGSLNIFNGGSGSRNTIRWAEYNVGDTISAKEKNNDILYDIDIKKLLLVPMVAYTNTTDIDTATISRTTLASYIYNETYNTYPYVTGVYLNSYYNTGTYADPQWSNFRAQNLWVMPNCKLSDEITVIPKRGTVTITYSVWNSNNYGGCIMGLQGGGILDLNDTTGDFNKHPVGCDPDLTHYVFNGARTKVMYCRQYSESLKNEIYTQLAFLGLFFLGDGNYNTVNLSGAHISLTDNNVYLGTIRNDGCTYGEYTHGAENANQKQYSWTTSNDAEYNPYKPPNILPPSNPTTFNPVTLANGGLKRYVLDDSNMASFGEELWNIIDTTDPDALIQNQTLTNFLTNNPLDCIVSIKRFPLADMSQGTAVNPMLGKVKILNVLAYPFDASSTILSCGSLTIPRFFNDFRDYMVQYELILPFCGTLSLDAESVTGKTIDVKYAIDYTTGTCTAWVLTTTSDGKEIVIDSANGNCCIDIPMSGVQTATLTGQIYNANENLKTAKFNTIVSGVTGVGNFIQNVREHNTTSLINQGANLINDIHKIQKAEWNIDHTEIPLKMIGASSGCNSFQIELTPRLTAYVPKTVDGFNYTDYLHTVGASVCDSCTIGNYSGYVEISNVDLSGFNATATEKNIISNLLSGGVYL